MNKRNLLDRIGAMGEDRLLLAHILDRAQQAQERSIPACTDFLSPQQQVMAQELLHLAGISAYLRMGGYEEAERRVLLFLPDWMEPELAEPPIRLLRAVFRSGENLSHRDFLGSLMGMGVVREKIGDILVSDAGADVLVLDSVADFLLQSWNSAGRVRLTVSEAELSCIHIPQAKWEWGKDTVSSLRLDAVAAVGFRTARGKAADLICAGRVQVNWQVCTKPDRLLTEGDTVSARGAGKFQLAQIGGFTRKGRTAIIIKRYV